MKPLNDIDLGEILGNSFNPADDEISFVLPANFEDNSKEAEIQRLNKLVQMMDRHEELMKAGGQNKWFQKGGPFGIEKLKKHKAFFDAGSRYGERLFMAANRVGKTISGAFESSCHATG
ncbi:terminase family protein [Xanthomonas phage DES1]|nr:terminase family protein [Xanthomonas phage DES1]